MTLHVSQALLIGAISIFLLYTFRLRTVLIERLVYLALVGAGIAFVIQPRLSSWVANLVGIGRGTDLVVYTFIIFSLVQAVNVASYMNRMERQITQLARRSAIEGAQRGGQGDGAEEIPQR